MGNKNNSINFARVLAWVLFALPILIIYTMSNDPSAKGIGGFAVLGGGIFCGARLLDCVRHCIYGRPTS